jgi:hypothetical protein
LTMARRDEVQAKIQESTPVKKDGGPEWLPVSSTPEDVGGEISVMGTFGSAKIQIFAKTVEDASTIKTILGILSGAMGHTISVESAIKMVSRAS